MRIKYLILNLLLLVDFLDDLYLFGELFSLLGFYLETEL